MYYNNTIIKCVSSHFLFKVSLQFGNLHVSSCSHNQQSKTSLKSKYTYFTYMLTAAAYESKEYILLINDHYRAEEYHKNVIILCIYHSCIHIILLLWIPNESYIAHSPINYYVRSSDIIFNGKIVYTVR